MSPKDSCVARQLGNESDQVGVSPSAPSRRASRPPRRRSRSREGERPTGPPTRTPVRGNAITPTTGGARVLAVESDRATAPSGAAEITRLHKRALWPDGIESRRQRSASHCDDRAAGRHGSAQAGSLRRIHLGTRPTAARWWREYSGSGLAIVAKRVRANFSQMSYTNTAIGAAPLGCGRAGLANHLGPGLRAWPRDRMQDTCREPSRDCSSPTPGISAALVTSTESTRLGFSTSRVQTRQLERTVYGRPVVAVAPRAPRPSRRQAANPGTQRARRRARGHHRRPRRRRRVKPVGARPSQPTN